MTRLAALALLAALLGAAGCATQGGGAPQEPPLPSSEQADVDRRARLRLELASAYYGRGQYSTALEELKLALAAKPDSPEAYNLRGLIYAAMGDERQASESYQRSLQLSPRDGDTMHNFGWMLCQQGRYADADAQFRQAMAQPQYANQQRTLMTQGVCLARAGQLEGAEAALVRSYELDPGNPVTAVNLSEVLYRRGQYERARFYIRRVNSNVDLVNAQTLWLAARIEHKLGNQAGLQDFGKQLRDRFPQSPEARALERGAFDG